MSRRDPGFRSSSFDFTWRLPWMEKWLTLYSDSIVHDDVSPLAAPRRAAVNPGLYLSHVPMLLQHVDSARGGRFYRSGSQSSQGGQIPLLPSSSTLTVTQTREIFLGTWMGREGKGGQVWLTDWLSAKGIPATGLPQYAKVSKTFIPEWNDAARPQSSKPCCA